MICQCGVPGCPKDARWQIAFRIWKVRETLRTTATCVEGMCGICVCDEHTISDPDKFFTPLAKERIAVAFLQRGRGMPDFSTAEIIHIDMNGEPLSPEEAASLDGLPDMVGHG